MSSIKKASKLASFAEHTLGGTVHKKGGKVFRKK
jgi:hypothetical protein